MFVIAVFFFACGIYLDALYEISLKITIPLTVLLLFFIPFCFKKNSLFSVPLIFICFMFAGMSTLGVVTVTQTIYASGQAKEVYSGLIIESSPNTKILRLTNPMEVSGLKTILRTTQQFNINDNVKVFGELREIHPTFNNPYLLSWKWLKKLEGISYELRGKIISISPGNHITVSYTHLTLPTIYSV